MEVGYWRWVKCVGGHSGVEGGGQFSRGSHEGLMVNPQSGFEV